MVFGMKKAVVSFAGTAVFLFLPSRYGASFLKGGEKTEDRGQKTEDGE
jgi:hypothetical protein